MHTYTHTRHFFAPPTKRIQRRKRRHKARVAYYDRQGYITPVLNGSLPHSALSCPMHFLKHTLRFLTHPVERIQRRKRRQLARVAYYDRYGYVNPLLSGSLPLAPLPPSSSPDEPRGIHPRPAPPRPALRPLALADLSYLPTSQGTPQDVEDEHQPKKRQPSNAVTQGQAASLVQEDADSQALPLFGFEYRNALEVTIKVVEAYAAYAGSPTLHHENGKLQFVVHKPQIMTVVVCDALGNQMVQLYSDWVHLGETITLVIDDAGWPTGTYSVRAQGEHFIAIQGFTLTR